jgi:hypothetical protein
MGLGGKMALEDYDLKRIAIVLIVVLVGLSYLILTINTSPEVKPAKYNLQGVELSLKYNNLSIDDKNDFNDTIMDSKYKKVIS